MATSLWRNPEVHGLLGFILYAAPMLLFFFRGLPGASMGKIEIGSSQDGVVDTIWLDAFDPTFLFFVFMAGIAVWGCYKDTAFAWVGGFFVLIFSILGIFSWGLLTLPGAVLLLAGAALKASKKQKTVTIA